MQNKKRKNRTKKGTILLRLSYIALGLYLVVSIVYAQVEIASRRAQLAALEAQVAQQQTKTQELTRVLNTDDEGAYMESVAREKMGYARPDERIFIDVSGN